MKIADHLRYADSHEWIDPTDPNAAAVGVSDHAQSELGDIVYVELPEPGRAVKKGESFGVIESVKAANDLYAPATGEVIEVNETLAEEPSPVNSDPYGEGWMIKIRVADPAELDSLRNAQGYGELIS